MFYEFRIFSLFTAGMVGFDTLPSSAMFVCFAGQYFRDLYSISKKGAKLISDSASGSTQNMNQCISFINYQVRPHASETSVEVGDTALIIACRLGNSEGVRMLLLSFADCNIQNARGLSALHAAVEFNHIDCIRLLLARFYIRVNVQTCSSDTPLLLACRVNNTVAVELLLERGADQYITNLVGNNAIQEAGLLKHHDCLQHLLKPSYVSNSSNTYWYTILHNLCDTVALKGVSKVLFSTPHLMLDCVGIYSYALGFAVRTYSIYLTKKLR